MKDSLRFKDTFEDTVRHSLLSAVEHCLYECPVVHSQRTEIPFLSKIDVVLLQDFFVSSHLDSFIVDDDAVEVEEYGFDHWSWAFGLWSLMRSRWKTQRPKTKSISESPILLLKQLRQAFTLEHIEATQ